MSAALDARAEAATREELRTAARLLRNELFDAPAEIEGAQIGNYYPVVALERSRGHFGEASATGGLGSIVAGIGRVKEMNRDHFPRTCVSPLGRNDSIYTTTTSRF